MLCLVIGIWILLGQVLFKNERKVVIKLGLHDCSTEWELLITETRIPNTFNKEGHSIKLGINPLISYFRILNAHMKKTVQHLLKDFFHPVDVLKRDVAVPQLIVVNFLVYEFVHEAINRNIGGFF